MDLLGGQQSQQRLQGVADDQFLVVAAISTPTSPRPSESATNDRTRPRRSCQRPSSHRRHPTRPQNTKLIPMMGTSSTSTIQSIDHIYPTRTFRDSSAMTEVMIWSRSWRGTNPVRLRSLVQSGMRRSMSSKPGP